MKRTNPMTKRHSPKSPYDLSSKSVLLVRYEIQSKPTIHPSAKVTISKQAAEEVKLYYCKWTHPTRTLFQPYEELAHPFAQPEHQIPSPTPRCPSLPISDPTRQPYVHEGASRSPVGQRLGCPERMTGNYLTLGAVHNCYFLVT